MKKSKKIVLLFVFLIFLSTYHPKIRNDSSFEFLSRFRINSIEILNNSFIETNEIKQHLTEVYNKNIFLLKTEAIQNPLRTIDFIESIEIKKRFPNKIIITVNEEEPMAIFIQKGTKSYITKSGKIIQYKENLPLNNLPLVFGLDAQKNFVEFFNLLKKNKFPVSLIRKFYYFNINRWDLHLKNKKIIKLPDSKFIEAAKTAIILLENEDFEKYTVFDLRIHGKIITR